jgi:hypothetical protein
MIYYVDFGEGHAKIATMRRGIVDRYVKIVGMIPLGIRYCAVTIVEQRPNGDLLWIKAPPNRKLQAPTYPIFEPLNEAERAELLMQILRSTLWT